MNESYFQSVIADRKQEVLKLVEDNQTYSHLRDSAASQQESAEQGKNIVSLWVLTAAKWLKGVFAIDAKDSLKV